MANLQRSPVLSREWWTGLAVRSHRWCSFNEARRWVGNAGSSSASLTTQFRPFNEARRWVGNAGLCRCGQQCHAQSFNEARRWVGNAGAPSWAWLRTKATFNEARRWVGNAGLHAQQLDLTSEVATMARTPWNQAEDGQVGKRIADDAPSLFDATRTLSGTRRHFRFAHPPYPGRHRPSPK